MRVLGISGSLRDGSYNTAVLLAAAKLLPEGSEFELYGELESLPPYNQDRDTDDPPAAVADLRRLIAGADALLIATPEYNGTIPGQLKQVVDWGSRPYGEAAALFGKPVAVLSASVTDYGAVWANDHLRRALGIAGARVVDVELAISRVGERVNAAGELIDPETTGLLTEAVTTLVHSSQALARA
jgi:chromate reductase